MSHSLDPATRFHCSGAQRHTRTRKCGATLNSTMSLLSVQPIEAAAIVPRLLDAQQRVYHWFWSFRKSQQLPKYPAMVPKSSVFPACLGIPMLAVALETSMSWSKHPRARMTTMKVGMIWPHLPGAISSVSSGGTGAQKSTDTHRQSTRRMKEASTVGAEPLRLCWRFLIRRILDQKILLPRSTEVRAWPFVPVAWSNGICHLCAPTDSYGQQVPAFTGNPINHGTDTAGIQCSKNKTEKSIIKSRRNHNLNGRGPSV